MKRARARGASALAVVVALLAPRVARAEHSTNECTAAAESAQLLRNAGKLVQSRAQLLVCMKTCPRIVQNDCGQWLHDVDARIASVVVRATDARGQDVSNVRVSMDGTVLMSRLDGLAAQVDPGVHRFVFEREGNPTVVEDVTIREGEKARTIAVKLPDPPKAHVEVAPTPARPLFPVSSIVLGVVGVAGMGVFTAYHVSASSDLDAMRAECAPNCPPGAVDTLDQKIFVSNVALGVGASALAGAILVFLFDGGWRTSSSPAPTSGSARRPFVVRF